MWKNVDSRLTERGTTELYILRSSPSLEAGQEGWPDHSYSMSKELSPSKPGKSRPLNYDQSDPAVDAIRVRMPHSLLMSAAACESPSLSWL